MRSKSTGGAPNRGALRLAILLTVTAIATSVILSPLGLDVLDQNLVGVNWRRLARIAQTYGAVSAIIAAIALVGVAVSLIIQSREAKAARTSSLRALHVELLKMAMDDPAYMECWGVYLTDNFDTERQYAYVNLIVSHWQSMYEIGECTDSMLLAMAAELFSGDPGRRYWRHAGPARLATNPN